ncbi:S-adenosyl-L-methionine-dependent methyltransferase [Apiospora saccharicola]
MASPAASLLPTMKLEDVAHEDSVLVQGQLTESVASPSSAFVSQVRTAAAALFLTMGDGKDTAESSIAPGSPSTIGDEDEFEPSDFDEESLDDTTSVGSSVYGHSYRNGRRYHKARNYKARQIRLSGA